jgi:thioredoxin-related protein
MKSKLTLLACLVLLLSFCSNPEPAEGPLHAEEIMKMAMKKARKQKKNIFIMWHASWCGWCHRMDTLMNDESIKEYFDDNYVIEHLVVKEAKDKKHLENPGAMEMLTEYKGDKSGIPFWVVLDKKGELLMDSFMEPGKNTGCPALQEEVDYWIKVLSETAIIPDKGLDEIAAKFLRK